MMVCGRLQFFEGTFVAAVKDLPQVARLEENVLAWPAKHLPVGQQNKITKLGRWLGEEEVFFVVGGVIDKIICCVGHEDPSRGIVPSNQRMVVTVL